MAGNGEKKRGAKGGGTAYQRPDGLWVAEVTRGGVRHRRTGATEGVARARLAEALGEKIWDPKNPTVADYLRSWVGSRANKDATNHKYAQIIERHIVPHLGSIRLKELTQADVRTMVNELGKRHGKEPGLKPGTIRNIRSPLRSACRDAIEDRLLSDNPADITISGRSGDLATSAHVSAAAAARLLDACRGDEMFALWAILLYGGLRAGEALSLRLSDVDLEERRIAVRRSLTRVKDERGVMVPGFTTPKTGAGAREVPMAAELVPVLARHIEARMASGRGGDLMFPGKRKPSMPTSQTTALRKFYRVLDGAGIGRIRQHDLRHWCATLLIGRGVVIPTVSKILGHANPSITYKLYAHVLLETEKSAADVIQFYPSAPAA